MNQRQFFKKFTTNIEIYCIKIFGLTNNYKTNILNVLISIDIFQNVINTLIIHKYFHIFLIIKWALRSQLIKFSIYCKQILSSSYLKKCLRDYP